jgi:methylenetetrahydrofolate reductase (NADPH)
MADGTAEFKALEDFAVQGSPRLAAKCQVSEPIIRKLNAAIAEKRALYSFEFFPPKTDAGIENLYARIERLGQLDPAFIDVTWGAGGSTAELTHRISQTAQKLCCADVMMHLTCTNIKIEDVKDALKQARAAGIRNILALRGDPPHGADVWERTEGGLSYGADLVKLIREEHGDWFGIGVAGYPEGHTQATSLEEDMVHLKAKVDAGADFIVTQLFYDCDLYLAWVDRCRAAGIMCPIVPGIMPIQSFAGFQRMTTLCKTFVPQEIRDALAPIEHDDAAVKQYGVQLATRMCRRLLAAGAVCLHFYTLNLEKSVVDILEALGFITPQKAQSNELPWAESQVSRRGGESVRPIFWSNRPHSYMDRTARWDEFPNGRWGNAASPAFGDLSDYHLYPFKAGRKAERRALWGEAPATPLDIFNVFAGFVRGKVPRLPWCERALSAETAPLRATLEEMNLNGFLTINSQPRVNGARSDDDAVGWGGPGGYVYQKAYVEFFASPALMQRFAKAAAEFPSLTFQAFTAKGEKVTSNTAPGDYVTAVTWGVFPQKEVLQPTVVDSATFGIWKDEAFALWRTMWQTIYERESPSWKLIQEIHDSYYLVNVVDNDYVGGDIFTVFQKIMAGAV